MRLRRNPFTGGKNIGVNKQWQKYLKRDWYFSYSCTPKMTPLEKLIRTERELSLTQDSFINGWRAAFAWLDECEQERKEKK